MNPSLDFCGASRQDIAAALALVCRSAAVPGMVATLDPRSFSAVPASLAQRLAERIEEVARETFALACSGGEFRPIPGRAERSIVTELCAMLDWADACKRSTPAGRKGSFSVALEPTGGTVCGPESIGATIAYHWARRWFGDGPSLGPVSYVHVCEECRGEGRRRHARIRGRFVKCDACNGAAQSAPVAFPSLPSDSSIPAQLRRCFP